MRVDEGAAHVAHGGGGGENVVDAPADVLGAHTEPLAPPRVVIRSGLEVAKGVDPAGIQPPIQFSSLLGEKSAGALVVLGAGQIDLAMGLSGLSAIDQIGSDTLLARCP